MKKLLSIFLISCMLINILPLVSSAEDDYAFDIAETLLVDLEVIKKIDDISSPVTRAEFVSRVIALTNTPKFYPIDPGYADVPVGSAYYEDIRAAYSMGLISPAVNFNPDEYITLEQAQKILIILLGYEAVAIERGGYPLGYTAAALNFGICKDLITEENLSYRNIVVMLYNCLSAPLAEVEYHGDSVSIHKGDNTLLWNFWGLTELSGTFDGTEFYSRNNRLGCGVGYTSFDSKIYNSGKFHTNDYFGMEATIYVTDDKIPTIKSVYISDSNNILTISADDISYNDGVFTYEDARGNNRKISLSLDTAIMYNGCEYILDPATVVPDEGSLTFILNGSGCETLIIKAYENVIIEGLDAESYLVVDKYDSRKNVCLDPSEDGVRITNHMGEDITFDDLKTGTILSVFKSPDSRVIEAVSIDDSIFGVCTEIGEDIYIDGQMFSSDKTVTAKRDKLISLGQEAVFYFDIEGKIAYISPKVLGKSYGYMVIGVYYQKGLESSMKARIMRVDGTIGEYKFASSFTVNSVSYKPTEESYNALKSTDYDSLKCDVVLYTLNDNDEITSLEYADNITGNASEKTTLYKTYTIEDSNNYSYYKAGSAAVGLRIFLASTAKVFKVASPAVEIPGGIADKNYKLIAPASLGAGSAVTGYYMVGYTTDPDSGIADYMLMQSKTASVGAETVSDTSYPHIVDKIVTKVIDGEPCEVVTAYSYYNYKTPIDIYSTEDNYFSSKGIVAGSVIRFSNKDDGEVIAAELLYKPNSSKLEDQPDKSTNSTDCDFRSATGDFPIMQAMLCYAYRERGEVLELVTCDKSLTAISEADVYPIKPASFRMFKYNERTKAVEEVEPEILKDYVKYNSDCTKLLIHLRYGDPISMFIVE